MQIKKISGPDLARSVEGRRSPASSPSSRSHQRGNLEITTHDEGWVKLHRKIQRSSVFQNEGLLKVWIWCLLRANHEDTWVPVKTGRGTTQVLVKRGQFIFGRKTAAKALKMKEPTVQKRMMVLKNLQNLIIQSNTHYSIVTILNYDVYQGSENEEVSPKVSGKYQASITDKKNNKNKRIYVEDSIELQLASFLLEEILKNKPDFKQPNLQIWAREIDLMIRTDGRIRTGFERLSVGLRMILFGKRISFLREAFENSLTG